MPYINLYVTFPDKSVCDRVTKELLDARLIACVNTFNIESAYWWDGTIESDNEVAALFKTSHKREKEVLQRIEALHPFDVPCIEYWSVSANAAYERWIEESTKY